MKMAVSYININKQADKSLAELINLGRRYVATIDALYPKYRADCNRNASLYTAEALDNQRKEAKKEYSIQLLNTFNELWRDVGVEVDLMRETLACCPDQRIQGLWPHFIQDRTGGPCGGRSGELCGAPLPGYAGP